MLHQCELSKSPENMYPVRLAWDIYQRNRLPLYADALESAPWGVVFSVMQIPAFDQFSRGPETEIKDYDNMIDEYYARSHQTDWNVKDWMSYESHSVYFVVD